MNERMESLDALVRQVMPLGLPCPRGMVLDALRVAAKDLCEQAAVWRVKLDETALQGDAEVPLTLPRDAKLAFVLGVWLEGNRLDPSDYRVEGDHICLRATMPRECAVTVEAALRPSRLAEHLPERLIEEWGDVLAYGAQARLKAMSGNKVEWSDGVGAQIALEQYKEGMARARIRAMASR